MVAAEVGITGGVGVDGLVDEVGADGLPVAEVGGGDEAFEVEFARVKEEADEGLAVVGFLDAGGEAADVGEDDDAGAGLGGEEGGEGEEEDGARQHSGYLRGMALSVQIFGVKNSQATRAAERFFKERRFQIHYVDLKVKPLAAGELRRFTQKFGSLEALLDKEGKEWKDAGLGYLRIGETEMLARLEKEPKLLKLPLVRCGNLLAVGPDEAGWKAMVPVKAG